MNGWLRQFQRTLFAACVIACAASTPLSAAPYSAAAVKAAFLYRFAGYIEWPAEPDKDAPFTIAVLDDAEVAEQLRALLPEQRVQNRPARVRTIDSIAELGDAQVLYIGSGGSARTRKAIQAVASRPVLIVTDDPRGLALGGTINFLEEDKRIRFEVSLAAAQRSGLRISSELLAVALRVKNAAMFGHDAFCPFYAFECATRVNGS